MPNDSRIGQGFNRLSSIYDFVVWLVFGNKIQNLKRSFIQSRPTAENTLIIGGGTGEILEYALESNISSRFVYAELSDQMIIKTKARISADDLSRIEFCNDYRATLGEKKFNYIIVPFVLDCYRYKDVKIMLNEFTSALAHKGSIVFFDFNLSKEDGFESRQWKIYFIKLLYVFFRLTTSIPAKRLPSFSRLFSEAGYYKAHTTLISKGWIQAIEWKRESRIKASA